MGVCQRKAVLQRLLVLVFEYNPARSRIDHVMCSCRKLERNGQ